MEPKENTPPEPAKEESQQPVDDEGALEGGEQGAAASAAAIAAESKNENSKKSLKQRLGKFNIYLLLFALILVIAAAFITIAYFQSKKASTATIKTQTLTQSALDKVAASDATIGTNQQILNVQSSAVFAGKVLVRSDLEVAGNLQLGGTIALTSLSVSGTSALSTVSISKDLSIAGSAGIQGSLSIAKGLQVNGNGTFSGSVSTPQLTTTNLQVAGDLVLTHHLVAGGSNPSRTNGSAIGSGGTASVSGSDTGGSVTINIGANPVAGCFVTINFAQSYHNTPHVLLTKIGLSTASVNYYVNRSATSFSICTINTPTSGETYNFDYFVIE
jgi:cytoskeletal protein CcmA (bactofilin family)